MYQLSQSAGSSVNTDCKSQLYLILIGRLFWELCQWTLNKLYWRDHTLCNCVTGKDHRNNLSHTRMTGVLLFKKKKKKCQPKSFQGNSCNQSATYSLCKRSVFVLSFSLLLPTPHLFFYCLSQMSWSSCWSATVPEHAKWTLSTSFLAENLWQKIFIYS